jgi:hypothetical protein
MSKVTAQIIGQHGSTLYGAKWPGVLYKPQLAAWIVMGERFGVLDEKKVCSCQIDIQ